MPSLPPSVVSSEQHQAAAKTTATAVAAATKTSNNQQAAAGGKEPKVKILESKIINFFGYFAFFNKIFKLWPKKAELCRNS